MLFDMDGTIVDSTTVVERIWRQFAERFGVDVEELFAYSHGRRSPDTVRHFLSDGFDPVEVTREQEARELTLVDGIVEVAGAGRLLQQLQGAPVAVVTSAPRELAEIRMEAAGLTIPAVLVAAEDAEHGKPSPQGYLIAAEQLGVDVADCVVFEDADAGIQAAVASGARTIVVGGLDSPAAQGLERIPDFTSVTTEYDAGTKRILLQL
ncbi:MAG: hydrolase [Marmoricola sp.]|nr:hydrolase [Marmoricola sp.]